MDPVSLRRRSVPALVLLVAVACSSGTTPTSPPTTSPTTTVAPAPAPTPVGPPGCPLGFGSGRHTCQGDVPSLLPSLDAAIDKLVAEQPQLFNLDDPPSVGGYLIYDVNAFYDGVIANLQAQGLCAQTDSFRERISLKDSNDYDETYDIVSAQARIRRGPVTYINTCTPAHFPLSPDDAVASVAVSFFRINCPMGGTPPPTGLNQLPMECVGTITATPRDASGNKLPPDLHGSEVTWFFRAGEATVVNASPDEDVVFNLRLYPREVGEFSICATVKGRTGCLNGRVVPAV